jgi:hypothetical protein
MIFTKIAILNFFPLHVKLKAELLAFVGVPNKFTSKPPLFLPLLVFQSSLV